MENARRYAKAIWAFLTTAVAAVVIAADGIDVSDGIDTGEAFVFVLGLLTVLGVYQVRNDPPT